MAGALGSLCEGGEEEQGGSEGLLEASHAGKGAGSRAASRRLEQWRVRGVVVWGVRA